MNNKAQLLSLRGDNFFVCSMSAQIVSPIDPVNATWAHKAAVIDSLVRCMLARDSKLSAEERKQLEKAVSEGKDSPHADFVNGVVYVLKFWKNGEASNAAKNRAEMVLEDYFAAVEGYNDRNQPAPAVAMGNGDGRNIVAAVDPKSRKVMQWDARVEAGIKAFNDNPEGFKAMNETLFAKYVRGETTAARTACPERALWLNVCNFPDAERQVFVRRVLENCCDPVGEHNFLMRRQKNEVWRATYDRDLVDARLPILAGEAGMYTDMHVFNDVQARQKAQLAGGDFPHSSSATYQRVFARGASGFLVGGEPNLPVQYDAQGRAYVDCVDIATVTRGVEGKIRDLERRVASPNRASSSAAATAAPPRRVPRQNDGCFNCKAMGHTIRSCPKELSKEILEAREANIRAGLPNIF